MHMKQEWLPIIAEQERRLRFKKFDYNDAYLAGKTAVDLIQSKYSDWGKGIAVRVIVEHETVFSVMMNDTCIENEWWMMKKLNTVYKTGVSSLRAALEFQFGVREHESWCEYEKRFALCGGCIPIWLQDGSVAGYMMISNLPHEMDHQLLAEALAAVAGVTVPSIME